MTPIWCLIIRREPVAVGTLPHVLEQQALRPLIHAALHPGEDAPEGRVAQLWEARR